MKFIFVDNFDLKWNSYSKRDNSGISSSQSVMMCIAEGIAKNNENIVELVSIKNNIIEGNYLEQRVF